MSAEAGSDRFGPFGGRYVPETLIPALDELEAAYEAARARSGISDGVGRTAAGIRRASFSADRCAALFGVGGRSSVAETRGPEPHRRAQDQQHGRAGVAGAAHGEAVGSSPRRARGSTAWRRRRSARASASVRRVHGRGGHAAPGAERLPHGADGREGRAGDVAERARSRMRPARRFATGSRTSTDSHYIIGSVVGPAPYPRMVREFQSVIGREARAQMLERAGRLPGDGGRMRGRRVECDGDLPRVRARMPRWNWWASRRRARDLDTERHWASLARGRRACCTVR